MPALWPHGQGEGSGQPNVDKPAQGEEGSQKIPKTVRTFFMDDPKEDYQKPLKKFIFLLNPVPFNWKSYTKQKRLGTSDQSFFSLRNKYTKISLLVMQFIVYYQTKFDGVI